MKATTKGCCKHCGKFIPFTPPPDNPNANKPTYCNQTHRVAARKKRSKERDRKELEARIAAAPPLLPVTHCIPCDKAAERTLDAIKARYRGVRHRTGHVNEVRYYECPEGFWHWTSQLASKADYVRSNR